MGQWSQRRRGGGGQLTLNFLTDVEFDGSFALIATYRTPLNPEVLTPSGFIANPGNFAGDSVDPESPDSIRIVFGDDIAEATTLTYSTPTVGFLVPQTITI